MSDGCMMPQKETLYDRSLSPQLVVFVIDIELHLTIQQKLKNGTRS